MVVVQYDFKNTPVDSVKWPLTSKYKHGKEYKMLLACK